MDPMFRARQTFHHQIDFLHNLFCVNELVELFSLYHLSLSCRGVYLSHADKVNYSSIKNLL